jgi:hypothetical protein
MISYARPGARLEHVDGFGFGHRPEGQQSLKEHSRLDVGSELGHLVIVSWERGVRAAGKAAASAVA